MLVANGVGDCARTDGLDLRRRLDRPGGHRCRRSDSRTGHVMMLNKDHSCLHETEEKRRKLQRTIEKKLRLTAEVKIDQVTTVTGVSHSGLHCIVDFVLHISLHLCTHAIVTDKTIHLITIPSYSNGNHPQILYNDLEKGFL